jgi:hypothetical protein
MVCGLASVPREKRQFAYRYHIGIRIRMGPSQDRKEY